MTEFRLIFTLFFLILVSSAKAVNVEYSNHSKSPSTDEVPVKNTETKESIETTASRFGLTSADWSTYEDIMKGEGRYHWSHLDPVWVLAINAKSNNERNRFARLAAKQEFVRVDKLMQFKNAYVTAFKSMYGDMPLMDLEAFKARHQDSRLKKSANDQKSSMLNINQSSEYNGDRMVLFMAINGCPSCDAAFIKLSQQQTPGVTLDVHFVGDTQSDISTWAKGMGIEPSHIEGGFITLNNDSTMYAQYGNPDLPAAYYYDSSKEEVLSISEVSAE
jgi:integrating conjugative element protein (TIGR03759 family)